MASKKSVYFRCTCGTQFQTDEWRHFLNGYAAKCPLCGQYRYAPRRDEPRK